MEDNRDASHDGEAQDSRESAAVAEALGQVMRMVFERGQSRAGALAADGRGRLELRQLRKDRDAMYRKLGREVRRLIEADEIGHPGLERGVERVVELEQKIAAAEAGAGRQTQSADDG